MTPPGEALLEGVLEVLGDVVGLVRDGGLPPGRADAVERACQALRDEVGRLRQVEPGRPRRPGSPAAMPDPVELVRRSYPRSRLKIRFLEYMQDRASAGYLELAERVHDDPEVGDKAIRQNVARVNLFAEERGLSLRFRACSGRVVKVEGP